MYRIIDGVLYEGKVSYDAWDVRTWEANGHREISASRPIIWEEHNAISSLAKGMLVEHVAELTDAEKEAVEAEKRERNLERAARRARTKCRRLIKAAQFNEMLTLTYRENQTDRALAKKHFKEWVRRMKKALGKFCYVAAPEPQARGAWHIHVATWKLPKMAEYQGVKIPAWRLGTEIWRDIVGENNGLCFVGGKDRHGRPRRARMGIAELAAYVSKYITKGYADAPAEVNRYSASDDLDPGNKSTYERVDAKSVRELTELLVRLGEGEAVVAYSLSKLQDRLWFCVEPRAGRLVLS
ncbi:hypothetical protein [Variovorax sp. tm]|uniref:rolling circle replication-associated protein n=1 Tax=Variovorax atrisoli TaxID=3394203 RepID=UPI003A8004F9